jgi:hypothetical protein
LKKIPNGSGDIVGAVNELMKTRGDFTLEEAVNKSLLEVKKWRESI